MDITSRTVFIVGGTSGIGLDMARRFAAAGSTVAIGGRRGDILMQLTAEGFGTTVIDVADAASVTAARDAIIADYPSLDVVVTMAGVLLPEDLWDAGHFAASETTIVTNVLGTIRVIDAFTPLFLERATGTFITVSSGIGFLPFPIMPTYGASKAAVHAYSEALRAQFAGTGVEVAELVPPAVATAPGAKDRNPHALDVDAYGEEVMGLLAQTPTPHEILVDPVKMHRWAERDGTYAELLKQRSAALVMLPGRAKS